MRKDNIMAQGAAPFRLHVPLSRAGRKDIKPAAIA